MVRGVYINRSDAERLLSSNALDRYPSKASSIKRASTAYSRARSPSFRRVGKSDCSTELGFLRMFSRACSDRAPAPQHMKRSLLFLDASEAIAYYPSQREATAS
jgi:hypothetical protein